MPLAVAVCGLQVGVDGRAVEEADTVFSWEPTPVHRFPVEDPREHRSASPWCMGPQGALWE